MKFVAHRPPDFGRHVDERRAMQQVARLEYDTEDPHRSLRRYHSDGTELSRGLVFKTDAEFRVWLMYNSAWTLVDPDLSMDVGL